MKNLEDRIAEVSRYLQCLTAPAVFPEVQNAVERQDKNTLVELCRKVQIPEIYTGVVTSVLLSIGPEQKWPNIW